MDTTVTIIGGGQAGLAMSRCLTELSIDHVLLERGQTANAWRTERWDSLRLLTPNWLTRLPGFEYAGTDPNGYMRAGEVADFLNAYRTTFDAPVHNNTEVYSVQKTVSGFCTSTSRGNWYSKSVVVATGACGTPRRPAVADTLTDVEHLAPTAYRNPDQISDGNVLVVGASASGAQIADELARAGHSVTLAVGNHVRLPRTYRGMDIHWWMDAIGLLNEGLDTVEDIAKARRLPSLQLVGSPEQRSLGCNELQASGVELVGRLAGVTETDLQFSGGFANLVASADLKMNRLLDRCDEFATAHQLDGELDPQDRPDGSNIGSPRLTIKRNDVKTIVWATGFQPNYPWLDNSLLDAKGAIVHNGGVMAEPGMYVLGLPFTRRRKSSFLDGVGPDAQDLARHLHSFLSLSQQPAQAA